MDTAEWWRKLCISPRPQTRKDFPIEIERGNRDRQSLKDPGLGGGAIKKANKLETHVTDVQQGWENEMETQNSVWGNETSNHTKLDEKHKFTDLSGSANPNRIKSKKTTPGHITVKMLKA